MPIRVAPKKGKIITPSNLNLIYLLTIKTTKITDKEIRAEVIATPLKPNIKIEIGVKTQVATVQKTIRWSVIFIFPIAFSVLVRGVEIDEKAAFTAKKVSEKRAGSHFEYFGTMAKI